jgi:hypothetical protein
MLVVRTYLFAGLVALAALLAAALGWDAFGLSASQDSTTQAHLAIDANPINGSGACFPVDAQRNVAVNNSFTVGLCLVDPSAPPVNGGISQLTLDVAYGVPLTATNLPGDGTLDLADNPDWNEGALGGAGVWDCNILNNPASAPTASPSPATITCATANFVQQPLSNTALLATIAFDAPLGTGTVPLTWTANSTGLFGSTEAICGTTLVCQPAEVIVSDVLFTPTLAPSTNTPEPTVTPSETPTPATPTVTRTPTMSPTPSSTPDPSTAPALAIDADPGNGTGPCAPVDAARAINAGDVFQVGLCLLNSSSPPVGGGLTTLTLETAYTAQLSATNLVGDGVKDLATNPDWNESGLGGSAVWDCNALNSPVSAPRASPSPAVMTCSTVTFADTPVSGDLMLAMLTLTAADAGVASLSWGINTTVFGGFNDMACFDVGFIVIGCHNASITVQGATATPTSSPTRTVTATPTPSPTHTPTARPAVCVKPLERIRLVAGILHRLGARSGEPRYDERFDLNHDGAIRLRDLVMALKIPSCRRSHH